MRVHLEAVRRSVLEISRFVDGKFPSATRTEATVGLEYVPISQGKIMLVPLDPNQRSDLESPD